MSYTPVELRHVRVGRSLLGYNRAAVEQLIEEVAQSFEATWRERGELADKVESLEKQLDELRRREHLLTQTLLAAEQAASDVRERARREAETIVTEAHQEARAISRAAFAENERLVTDSHRIEAMLRAALGLVHEGVAEPAAVVAAAPDVEPVPAPPVTESHPEVAPLLVESPKTVEDDGYGWAKEDTREFVPITPAEAEGQVAEAPEVEHGPEDDEMVAEPALERMNGGGSRDFDWGE
jgi:cell division initiation protein